MQHPFSPRKTFPKKKSFISWVVRNNDGETFLIYFSLTYMSWFQIKKGMNITSYIEKPLSLKYPFSGLSTITKYNNEKLTSTKFSEKKTLFWKIFHFLRFHFLVELKKFFSSLQQNEIRIRKIFEILNREFVQFRMGKYTWFHLNCFKNF